jgi:hypothetical protein
MGDDVSWEINFCIFLDGLPAKVFVFIEEFRNYGAMYPGLKIFFE